MQRKKKQEATAVAAGKVEVMDNLQKPRMLSELRHLENRNCENEGLGRAG
jgi:hypothetical protein